MNILLLNYEYPPLGGGAGNSTMNYAREFAKLGHNVVVLTSALGMRFECSVEYVQSTPSTSQSAFYRGGLQHTEGEGCIHLMRIPALRKYKDRSNPFQMIAYIISSVFYSRSIMRKYHIEKAIAFMSIPSGVTALFIKKVYKIPYLIFLGGGDVPGYQKDADVFHKVIFPIRKLVLKNAKRVIAVSEGLANLSMKTDKYPSDAIRTGVDVDFFKPNSDGYNALQFPNVAGKYGDEIIFIFVGRFTDVKQVELIIKQFCLLLSEGFNVKLNLVGNGPTFQELHEKYNKHKGQIIFHDWVDKATLLKIYQESDVMVNASTAEGLSNALLEAMACGLVVIASDVIGNNDLIVHEENGFLFSLDKQNGLYEEMKRLVLDKELLTNMKKISRDLVVEKYTWESSAKEYIKHLCYSNPT